eukprot:11220126-Lingulodinium_polyedra.AAC.1
MTSVFQQCMGQCVQHCRGAQCSARVNVPIVERCRGVFLLGEREARPPTSHIDLLTAVHLQVIFKSPSWHLQVIFTS